MGLSRAQVLRLGSVIAVLVAWELFGRGMPAFTSYPSAVAMAAWEVLVVDRTLLGAFGETLTGWATGFGIATFLGISLGFTMGRFRTFDVAFLPYVNALYASPRIALIPLLVLWAGIGFGLRVTIVTLSAIFPIIITVRDGSLSVAGEYLDVSRSFVASTWQTWKTAILPGSLPFVFAALRLGAQASLTGIIVAEMTAAITGTGAQLLDYAQFFLTDRLLVPVLVIGFFAIFLTAAFNGIQRLLTPWQRRTPRAER